MTINCWRSTPNSSRVRMVRYGQFDALSSSGCFAVVRFRSAIAPVVKTVAPAAKVLVFVASVVSASIAVAQDNPDLLDQYLLQIEKHISENDLEGARDKLNEALTADLRDESLELIHGQLRLLESLNQSGGPAVAAAGSGLTEFDEIAATDLLDSLRVAMENGELDKVRLFIEPTPKTDSLLSAVFNSYAAMRVEVSPPTADAATQSFKATLEFKEFTTKDGDTAFPAQAWKTHRLRVVKSNGTWQKVLW